MKFYLASGLKNIEAARKLIDDLCKHEGWHNTYNWTKHGSAAKMAENQQVSYADIAMGIAAAEIDGVRDAQVVVVLMPGGRGTHAELGAALACGKPVLMLYNDVTELETPYPCVFYNHPHVKRVCISELKDSEGNLRPLDEAVITLARLMR